MPIDCTLVTIRMLGPIAAQLEQLVLAELTRNILTQPTHLLRYVLPDHLTERVLNSAADNSRSSSRQNSAKSGSSHRKNSRILSLMKDTKWDELGLAMYKLGPLSPKWRTLDVENGYLSEWDGEWFYHFRNSGYNFIKWVEIAIESPAQRQAVLTELAKVHVPGESTETRFRVLGYAELGVVVDYLA